MTPEASGPMASAILLIDDDPNTIRLLHRLLADHGDIRFSTSAEEGLQIARDLLPDLILLDVEMPGLNGVAFCRKLKADPDTAGIAVIFVTSHRDADVEIEAFAAGAADFITKPIQPAIVRARVATHLKLKHLTDVLRQAALRDGLTGLSNRAALNDRLLSEWRRATRSDKPLSVLVIDVDHFKAFNDRYGHLAGDEALRDVASTLQGFARRSGDLAARFGGEEFVLLLPNTDEDVAFDVAEQLRRSVAKAPVDTGNGRVHLTVSIGLASRTASTAPPNDAVDAVETVEAESQALLRAADQALYRAKSGGRNRVERAPARRGRVNAAPVA